MPERHPCGRCEDGVMWTPGPYGSPVKGAIWEGEFVCGSCGTPWRYSEDDGLVEVDTSGYESTPADDMPLSVPGRWS